MNDLQIEYLKLASIVVGVVLMYKAYQDAYLYGKKWAIYIVMAIKVLIVILTIIEGVIELK